MPRILNAIVYPPLIRGPYPESLTRGLQGGPGDLQLDVSQDERFSKFRKFKMPFLSSNLQTSIAPVSWPWRGAAHDGSGGYPHELDFPDRGLVY